MCRVKGSHHLLSPQITEATSRAEAPRGSKLPADTARTLHMPPSGSRVKARAPGNNPTTVSTASGAAPTAAGWRAGRKRHVGRAAPRPALRSRGRSRLKGTSGRGRGHLSSDYNLLLSLKRASGSRQGRLGSAWTLAHPTRRREGGGEVQKREQRPGRGPAMFTTPPRHVPARGRARECTQSRRETAGGGWRKRASGRRKEGGLLSLLPGRGEGKATQP